MIDEISTEKTNSSYDATKNINKMELPSTDSTIRFIDLDTTLVTILNNAYADGKYIPAEQLLVKARAELEIFADRVDERMEFYHDNIKIGKDVMRFIDDYIAVTNSESNSLRYLRLISDKIATISQDYKTLMDGFKDSTIRSIDESYHNSYQNIVEAIRKTIDTVSSEYDLPNDKNGFIRHKGYTPTEEKNKGDIPAIAALNLNHIIGRL